jgi:hypothetical protein
MVSVALVAEDELSMAVLERIVGLSERPFVVTRRLVEHGCGNIRRSVQKYRNASHVVPHIVLTDLDQAECPTSLMAAWQASHLPASMLFRVAVRETESWLLGDRHGFSESFHVALNRLPAAPEDLPDPKQALINLVRRCGNRRLAAEVVPAEGSRASIGPLYNERLGAFARDAWDVEAASTACPSLARFRHRLNSFLL